MDRTAIEWTDATWNPIRGCSRVSEGCRNCYAERVAARFSKPGGPAIGGGTYPAQPYHGLAEMTPAGPRWTGNLELVTDKLHEPLQWKRPRRIFVNSMSDLFHDGVTDSWLYLIFAVMGIAEQHTFQVLTKRPERMLAFLNDMQSVFHGVNEAAQLLTGRAVAVFPTQRHGMVPMRWPLPNVWLGVSVENQDAADKRIPPLVKTPAAVRWISAEPLLGPVDLNRGMFPTPARRLDWVVVGGESGPGARPMHPEWARALRDQCEAGGAEFFFKQWGEWLPIDQPWNQDDPKRLAKNERWWNLAGGIGFHGNEVWRMRRVGKKAAGRELDGRTWDQYPERMVAPA